MEEEIVSFEKLKNLWREILENRFSQVELLDFLTLIEHDLPEGTLLREMGRVHALDKRFIHEAPHPVDLEKCEKWKQTTRIDGILPLQIPLASDITLLRRELTLQMDLLGLGVPKHDAVDLLEKEIALCAYAWFHERNLKANDGLLVEMRTSCPRSAMSIKEELNVIGYLPNGSRIVIFYAFMKGKDWLTMPDATVEHYASLEARRDPQGALKIYGKRYGE